MEGMTVRLDTRDVDLARAQVAASYCPHQLTPRGAAFHARHAEASGEELGVFSLSYGADPVQVEPEPFQDFVLFSRPVAGSLTVGGDTHIATGQTVALDARSVHPLLFGPGCRLLTVKLPGKLIARAAAASGRAADIRTGPALDPGPWDAVTRFVVREVLPHGLVTAPLGSSVAQLVAVAALGSFGAPAVVRRHANAAAVVRRACEYIDAHADAATGLLDIAAAADVAPRTLQDHFREQLGTSPTARLRQVRLERVHAELLAGQGKSVAEVASRWGFGNLGRFAADYRRTFGTTPSEDLRRA
ncbi:helix-turn-helix transcriptional regulator [Amycolatopsis rhabdoformis]|uniref:Helix-turn-helix transcriptional regulator n=1 Tax=Amycolatopsis rhabdoformis TaxID=1448059 RepID=A0ABZ1IEC9_9PSEU|nr:helix-turn-helix transcriptional regulator [Amycolatopsis rhabdoformis]WSE31894.1 helix-turn-helix transcriptional regulator [Amycolatopsis rhabdoformis]